MFSPIVFRVAGGDTGSALASGRSMVVQAHSGHGRLPHGTEDMVQESLAAAGAPEGTFVFVEGRELAVATPERAVAFTGVLSGGRPLIELTANRADLITVLQ